jgi:hydroxymethylbilane synthase
LTPLRVGTRGSALALVQARWVADRLGDAEIVEIVTSGDQARGVGDKSRWVDAIEAALVAGEIDLAVHSAKDVPAELAEGCAIVATPPRASALDVLVVSAGSAAMAGSAAAAGSAPAAGSGTVAGSPTADGSATAGRSEVAASGSVARPGDPQAALAALPAGARVGTSSLRRQAQLLSVRPDLEVVELRGNVDTRLRKLDAGEADGIVLAAAGLQRLAITREVTPLAFIPAPGQGTLAVEARADDERVRVAVQAIHDAATFADLTAERAAVRVLGATCHTPVGIHANDGTMRGFVGLPDGSAWVADELPGTDGEALSRRMLAAGAGDLLAQAEALA